MKALAAHPRHEEALDGLRRISRRRGPIAYKLATGEGPREIAAKVYRDPEKAFLVAYFLKAHPKSALLRAQGQTVLLPRLDFELERELLPEPQPEAEGSIHAQKGGSVSQGRIRKSEAPSKTSPAKRYEQALELKQAGNDSAAFRAFSSLSPEYKDVRKQLAIIRDRLNKKADAHYKQGLSHFLADDLQQAIKEWKQAIMLNPDHSQAEKSLHKARVLLKSLKEY